MDEIVDPDVLARWMDTQGLGGGPLSDVRPIGGGTQNVMLRFTRDRREYVLRRGPRHLRPRTNDALRREMQVLAALAGTDVPHPRLIAACPDEAVLGGAVFYLMESVDGVNPTVELTPALDRDRHGLGLAVVDALATVGAVDHERVGLGDVGRPEGFLERQVPRWLAELDAHARTPGYPGPEIPGVARVADWLERHRPTAWTPGILHGDYHLANVLVAPDAPRVAAVVDWEMCTIGDPLLDLGWLLATWPVPGEPVIDIAGVLAGGGLPDRAELVTRYAQRSTRDLSAITWYTVLACFKLGIVLEGTHARAFAGRAPVAVGERLHGHTLALFERALRLVAAG